MMRQYDRLSALHVRVSGDDSVDVLLGEIHERCLELDGCVEGATACQLRPETSVSGDLVVT
jgi:hypothetical protein